MTPSFFLKDASSPKPTSIIFFLTIPGEPKPFKRSTGKLIHPAKWSTQDQRASGTGKEAREINNLLENITEAIPGLVSDCRRNNRVLSSRDVEAALDIILQKKRFKEHTGPSDMFSWFEYIIGLMKSGDILTPGKKKKKYEPETIKHFEATVRKIRLFFIAKKLPASFDIVTLKTYEDFIGWCHGHNYADNSIGSWIKRWKGLGKHARKQGAHNNMVFEDEEFIIIKEETPDIWLDDKKIDKLFHQHCPAKHYDIARDWFVLDCDLGLRVSDLGAVSIEDFKGKHFQFVNKKTGAYVAIPITQRVHNIIKKWAGLPPAITDQKLNEYIKTVAKMAGLKNKFVYVITRGGKTVKELYQEWEWVSTHTCRRSFITRLLRMGVPHAYVMKLAGIKRYETLMRYFKETPEDVAEQMSGHDFFK